MVEWDLVVLIAVSLAMAGVAAWLNTISQKSFVMKYFTFFLCLFCLGSGAVAFVTLVNHTLAK